MSVILTNAVFLDYHDWRWVAKNMLDTVPPTAATLADLLDANTTAGGRLNRLITAAEQMLFAACVVGDRYTPTQVIQYGGELANQIVSGVTVGFVLSRRDRAVEDEKGLSLSYQMAQDYLEQLRRGERVFYAVPDVPESGLPGATTQSPMIGVYPPLPTQQAVRYFGQQLNPAVYGSPWPYPGGW